MTQASWSRSHSHDGEVRANSLWDWRRRVLRCENLMNIPLRPAPVSLTLALLFVAVAHADVVPAPLFTDHAVLQRDKPVPIWGTAEIGEKVLVTFGQQRREATAGYDGR